MNAHEPPGEFESEPVPGLPESLPPGERILWQGSPDWKSLARRVFHTRKVAAYFTVLLVWRVASGVMEGQPLFQATSAAAGLVPLALLAVGILALLAYMNSRATLYTVTNRRIVIRFGVAFVMAINLPYRSTQSAAIKVHPDGTGDIPLFVNGAERLGYFMLWPHARPWRFGRNVEPMLRSVPDVESVADTIARALAASSRATPNRTEGALSRSAATAPLASAVS